MSVLRSGIIFFDVTYSAAISTSAADAITFLMVSAIVNTRPLRFGLGSFSERKICVPDDMSSKQVRTEVLVDGQTVSKYSFVNRTADSAAARKSLFYH